MRQPIRSLTAIILFGAGFLLAISAAIPKGSAAATLSTSVIGMFPKDVGEFTYADLKSARKLPWFPQLREQLLPSRFREFEKFLASAGVDPDTQVEELAWGGISDAKGGGEEVVGVALGQFDPSAIETRFKQQKLAIIEDRGYHLYAFGSGSGANDIYFTFIDSNTAAFGHRPGLEKLLDVRAGEAESLMNNDKLSPLIKEANGSGLIWAVLDQSYTHLAIQQLLPQASQFQQATPIISRLQAMTINVQADDGVDAQFQAVCGSTDDANLLAAALQAGIMYRRYQEAQTDPALAAALDRVRITPSGDRLKVDAPVSQDELLSLIHTRAFATPM